MTHAVNTAVKFEYTRRTTDKWWLFAESKKHKRSTTKKGGLTTFPKNVTENARNESPNGAERKGTFPLRMMSERTPYINTSLTLLLS